MTNLTPNPIPDEPVTVPDDGEDITAAQAGPGLGPVRPGYQSLWNKVWCLIFGKVRLRSVYVDAANAGKVTGDDAADDQIYAPLVRGNDGQFLTVETQKVDAVAAGQAELTDHALTFTGTVASGGNPTATTAIKNAIYPLLVPKAWAVILTDAIGGASISDGASLNGVSIPAMGNQIDVVFGTAMDNANYLAVVNARIGTTPTPVTTIKQASKVTLDFGATDPRGAAIHIDVLVFGRQTS